MEDVDGKVFEEVLNLWSGKEGRSDLDLGDAMIMASVADRLEMLDVVSAIEASIVGELCAETCAVALMSSKQLGLKQVESAAWGMALKHFDTVSRTARFMGLDEETVGRLLEEDGLGVMEEEAFEGLLEWMKGAAGGTMRGRELLRKIRFGVMEQEYLEESARQMFPEELRDWIEGLVEEALRAKAAVRAQAPVELQLLDAKALKHRRGRGVDWGRYSAGGSGLRLQGHSAYIYALAECEGRMCSASEDGSIRIWNLATLEEEHVLLGEVSTDEDSEGGNEDSEGGYEKSEGSSDEGEAIDGVRALAVWEGQLISGHQSGQIRVWDVETGELLQELDTGSGGVSSLCVVGLRLSSGCIHGSVEVWTMGSDVEWTCEKKLTGHTDLVLTLAGWEGKLISGSADKTIRVRDLETGVSDAVMRDHRGSIFALSVHRERLFSASGDGTIRVWAVGTWAALESVEAYNVGSGLYPRCLMTTGWMLICGSATVFHGRQEEVRVYDVDTMACEHVVRPPAVESLMGPHVTCLAAAGGEVWGGVGSEVVVWGRE